MSYLDTVRKTKEELKLKAPEPSTGNPGKVVHDPIPPPCWSCGATMTRTKDISGKPWWACWECAKTA